MQAEAGKSMRKLFWGTLLPCSKKPFLSVFIGTYYSSFSAYIVRLRGYYSVKEHRDGYKSGGLRDTYYVPAKYKNVMRMYQAIHPPFYAQDFPSAWRDIDHLDHL